MERPAAATAAKEDADTTSCHIKTTPASRRSPRAGRLTIILQMHGKLRWRRRALQEVADAGTMAVALGEQEREHDTGCHQRPDPGASADHGGADRRDLTPHPQPRRCHFNRF
jgi:hypothetical protein